MIKNWNFQQLQACHFYNWLKVPVLSKSSSVSFTVLSLWKCSNFSGVGAPHLFTAEYLMIPTKIKDMTIKKEKKKSWESSSCSFLATGVALAVVDKSLGAIWQLQLLNVILLCGDGEIFFWLVSNLPLLRNT